jgi:hypothetical protein
MEQYANGKWQQIPWPFSTVRPMTITASSTGDLWGIGDIIHQKGCAPALVTEVDQGVFLHRQQGNWSDQVLP